MSLLFIPTSLSYILATLAAVLVGWIFLLNQRCKAKNRLPPGPISLPLIGSAWSLIGWELRDAMSHLIQQYGDMFTLDLGGTRYVVLASYDVINEVFVKNGLVSSGKPLNNINIRMVTDDGKGIAFNEGPSWSQHRKMLLAYFRDHCKGSEFEAVIAKEVARLVQAFHAHDEKPLNPWELLKMSSSNVINKAVYGHRFDYGDPQLSQRIKALDDGQRFAANGGMLALFPWMRYLPGGSGQLRKLQDIIDGMNLGIQAAIKQHEETYIVGTTRDLIDRCIAEARNQCHDVHTAAVVQDMFIAGTDTVATTLMWALIYMIHYPDVKERVMAEIADVVGKSLLPTLEHKSSMPYTQAVLLEVQRIAYAVSVVIHKVTCDVTTGGCTIPAGTPLIALLFATNVDDNIWSEPNKFLPERFLDECGELHTAGQFIPFGTGPRACPGASIAKMELFLFFVTILQHFDPSPLPGEPLPQLKGPVGFIHTPKPFNLILKRRLRIIRQKV